MTATLQSDPSQLAREPVQVGRRVASPKTRSIRREGDGASEVEPGARPVKVVLFCGGLACGSGTTPSTSPSRSSTVGQRPILWHLMKYYAHFGHNEFILCLGYGAHKIKEFFLSTTSGRRTTSCCPRWQNVEMLGTDIDDWKITFVDTGHDSNIGERLRRVQRYLERRRDVPRQLRRRPVRSAARHVRRDVPRAGQDRLLHDGPGPAHVPHRAHQRRAATSSARAGLDVVGPHQRRVLRAAP